jgi:predicted component of type VI protein secretion system
MYFQVKNTLKIISTTFSNTLRLNQPQIDIFTPKIIVEQVS